MRETQALARFVAETQFKDLPDALVEESRIVVLDTLAAGFVGTVQPWAQRIVEMVRELGGVAEATVLHQPWHTDISRAALANGAFFGAFECEPLSGSHASATVMPAALAVGEREHLDGQTWITAWVLGCEVSARIARTAVGLESVRGFHNPGTQGPFAAAAAVGKLYGFDAEQLTSAFGIAGSCAAGLLEFAWSGADTKRIHLGRASQLGLESALLARKGLRGPMTVLEGRYGYYNAFSQPPDLTRLLDGLGTEWAIRPPYQKSYATHVTHQSVVQAIQEWRHVHEIDPRHITRVVIRGTPRIMEARHAVRDPDTIMGGQYSLPFTAAVSLTRDMANPLVYNDEAIRDPVVRELAHRIELEPDATLPAGHGVFPSEVRIEAGDAVYALQTSPHKGSPLNPFTWDEICEKFRRYTREIINAEQAEAIIGGIAHLEYTADMAELTRLFVVG
jgi:2-methylcitrate dehydratase PrpD